MKKFNIKVGDRKFIVKAKDNIDAVRKLKSSLADASDERDVVFNKYYVKPGMKIWLNGKVQPIQNIEWGYKYAKVYTSSNEWYEFDVGKKVTVKDSSINDASYVDPKHYAEYGWKIEKDLYRDCYWEAVEQLAGKLKSEEEYKREIPKLARQIFEKHVKEIQAEINKLIASGRSQTSNYEKWAVEQAQNIMKKQGKDSADKVNEIKDYGRDIAVPGTNIIAIGIEDLFDYIRWIKDSLLKGDKSRAERLAEEFKRLLSERKKSVAGLPQYTNTISKYVQEAEKEFNSIKM